MKVNGAHVLHATPQQVWDALQDPAVLVRTIPGCQQLEAVGEDRYRARVHAGVASIKGAYDGEVSLSDQDPPTSYTLRASGSGGPGTIDATATVRLTSDGDGNTEVRYDADAVVGGAIAGVGQRVLAGVARRNAAAFFEAVDQHLSGDLEPAGAPPETEAATAEDAAPAPTVHRRPAPPSTAPDPVHLLVAALVGAAVALLGVLVGRRSAR